MRGIGAKQSWLTVGSIVVALVAASGCSVRRMALNQTSEVFKDGMVAVNEEPDYDFAGDAFPASLKTVEVMLVSVPDNPALLEMLAQGYASYAYMFVEDEADLADAAQDFERTRALKRRASGLYGRAVGFALRLLDRPKLRRALEEGSPEELKAELAELDARSVPALFWLTFAVAGRINLNPSDPALLAQLPKAEALLARVVELQPGYFHGLPLLVTGVTFASRPAMFGGDLPRGRKALDEGIAVSEGKLLLGRFLLARYYAVQAQDRELFCSSLDAVLAASPDVLPEQRLINTTARRWAARWRARAAALFEGAPTGCDAAQPTETTLEDDDGTLE